ncbi:MAG: hypothetical protein E4H27_09040 [Anaerolineales bacterium]|nr:MAG: hypothetical protein E4H27_09040 [Anaerolineales bacterium]
MLLPICVKIHLECEMDKYKVVVLISAGTEWRLVRALYPGVEVKMSPYGEWFTVAVPANQDAFRVCVMHVGWGKVAAAASAQYAIDTWAPDLVVNLGTCGGFQGHIARDTVILVEKTLIYDIIEQMGDPAAAIYHYTTELDLSWLQQPYPFPVHTGLLLSGDRDLVPEEVEVLYKTYGAIAGDWESGSIAWVATRNNVRCLILRWVTDLVGKDGGEAYDGTLDIFHERARYAMSALMVSLHEWLFCAGF